MSWLFSRREHQPSTWEFSSLGYTARGTTAFSFSQHAHASDICNAVQRIRVEWWNSDRLKGHVDMLGLGEVPEPVRGFRAGREKNVLCRRT